MDTALRLPIKVSSATSNFMIGVTAAASAGAYFVRGDIDVAIAAPVALGSVAGALLGARLLMGLPADKLRLFFVVVLVGLALQMLGSAFGVQRSEEHTSELQSLMRISYAVFCLKKKSRENNKTQDTITQQQTREC